MPYNIGIGSGAMTTASGLLFHGEPDGNIIAYDAATGDELWRFQTGMPAEAPVITYEVDGEQYVAIATGGSTQARAKGDGLWAFRLNGGLQPWPTGPKPPKAVVDGPSGEPVDANSVGIGSPASGEYSYAPGRARVKTGTTLTWTNNGALDHTVTFQGSPRRYTCDRERDAQARQQARHPVRSSTRGSGAGCVAPDAAAPSPDSRLSWRAATQGHPVPGSARALVVEETLQTGRRAHIPRRPPGAGGPGRCPRQTTHDRDRDSTPWRNPDS